jgi:23S rRNA pseudouridine1911/1915/1917 synthase
MIAVLFTGICFIATVARIRFHVCNNRRQYARAIPIDLQRNKPHAVASNMTTEDSTQTPHHSLLDALLAKYPDTPRTRAKQWIAAGRVGVNGVVVRRPNHPIAEADAKIELLDRNTTSLNCGRDGLPIHELVTLVYLDSSLAVVNKSAGILSVPAATGEPSSLEILKFKLRTLPPAYRRLEPLVVHRIDYYTSGLFCLAMNPSARANLIEQVSAHTMRREYIAFVDGRPRHPKGTWRNWLKLNADETEQNVVTAGTPDAAEAVTHYEIVAEYPRAGITKLRLRLETGRRHQIRVQAAHARLPLIGDRKYHPHYRGRFPRQALHAELLSLTHPEHNRNMTFTAPLPEDMQRLEAILSGKLAR